MTPAQITLWIGVAVVGAQFLYARHLDHTLPARATLPVFVRNGPFMVERGKALYMWPAITPIFFVVLLLSSLFDARTSMSVWQALLLAGIAIVFPLIQWTNAVGIRRWLRDGEPEMHPNRLSLAILRATPLIVLGGFLAGAFIA